MRTDLLGCPLDVLSKEEILARIQRAAEGGPRLRIEGINVAKMIEARRDPQLAAALDEAEIVHVDGGGVEIGARVLGLDLPPRRAGVDLMIDIVEDATRQHWGVYLLGAQPEVVSATAAILKGRYPGLVVSGARDGYFTQAEEDGIVADIATSGAKILFLGISSPKKELFVRRNWDRLGVAVALGVGGSFDVVSGKVRRAPAWMQRNSLEWLFRLIQEPRRLWWRYARTNTVFLALLLRAAIPVQYRSFRTPH